MSTTKAAKRADLINQFSTNARDAHRRGDVVARRQAEESIREIASRAEAKKIIAGLYVS